MRSIPCLCFMNQDYWEQREASTLFLSVKASLGISVQGPAPPVPTLYELKTLISPTSKSSRRDENSLF